ncbi:hypothetical protein CLOP_g8017 [Closterium sp. NIES-67]|nr:hypothetical protein CLOP_g8017 [Closterium sp. NIES-67]
MDRIHGFGAGAQPTVRTQWRLTQPELDELRRQLDYLLEKGFDRPSTSLFAAPILFTPKKDGGLRMCIDYRALNRVTIKSRYPIPRADELIDQLRGAKFFSKIDLRGGYHQIRVNEADCYKTAFRTRYGSYEYTVMPFGLTNAPSTFQLTMNEFFRPLLDKCVIVYLDDILIYSTTREAHLRDLEAVFALLQQHRLITKGSKCEFQKQELEFLGHVISIDGVKIDPKKIATIQAWKSPANLRELQSFLGFVNYVRRFIPNMVGVTSPLTDLLKKGKFYEWGRAAGCVRPTQTFPDNTSGSSHCRSSPSDFGEGLQPIAYESRKLNPAERNYPVHDKELLAIVHAFKVWRCYLTGADVTVRTDHKSLQFIRAQLTLNPRQIRLLDYLDGNDAILVVVDRLTKMAHFAACKTTITAEQTAKLFLTNIVRLYSIPSAIHQRSRPSVHVQFLDKNLAAVRHTSTSAHGIPPAIGRPDWAHQSDDGAADSYNLHRPRPQWEDSLPLEFAYNNAPSATTTLPVLP